MIVIFGTRFYGEVDRCGGQRQLTKFFHIYYVPLLPVDTLWVTQDVKGGYHGHAVAMSPRSVVAGYARIWGPLAAVGALATGSMGGFLASMGLLALSAWSWTWLSVRGARERRRSEYHMLALGTRCDPLKMDHQLASMLQTGVTERWARVAEGKTPEDVARHGAANADQSVLAYAALRLAARLAPADQGRKARESSERVLDARGDLGIELEGGPYRANAPAQLPAGAIVTDGGR